GPIVVLLSDSFVAMIEQGAGKVRRIPAIGRRGRSCTSTKKVWRDTNTESLEGNLRYHFTKSNSGNWSAIFGNPQRVGRRPRPKQDRSSLGQIDFDIAIEAFGDTAFIWSAILRGDARQIDPPPAVNRLERRPDLKCGKVLRPYRAKRKEGDH